MKKQPEHHIQEPRKKTNRELKETRIARVAAKKAEKARIEAEEEKNSSWDALNSLYAQCHELLRQPATIAPILRNSEIIANIENISQFTNRVNILQRDLKTYVQQLDGIHACHMQNVGNVEGFEQLMESYDIAVKYQNWMDSFSGVVLANHMDIINDIENATTKLKNSRDAETTVAESVAIATEESKND